jgi:hypothetical protein
MSNLTEAAKIITLPGNNYTVISESNLNTQNPAEYAQTNYDLIKNDFNLYQPAILQAWSAATDYRMITPSNLNNDNPSETNINKQLFQKIIFEELSYNDNRNAFRDSHSLGSFSTIPDVVMREGNENTANSAVAKKNQTEVRKAVIRDTNIETSQRFGDPNPNLYGYSYKVFGSKNKSY